MVSREERIQLQKLLLRYVTARVNAAREQNPQAEGDLGAGLKDILAWASLNLGLTYGTTQEYLDVLVDAGLLTRVFGNRFVTLGTVRPGGNV